MADSIFSKIVAGTLPSEKVYEDEHTFAFLDIAPTNPGHTLVIPKEPYENIYELPADLFQKVMATVHTLAPIIKKAVGADGVNIIMNNESAAGQIVPHAHIHIVPRFTGDGFRHWPGTPYKDGEASLIAEKIRSSL